MPKTEYLVNLAKKTDIRVCWLNCDEVFPELIEISASSSVTPGPAVSSIPVTATLNTQPIFASPEMPHFLLFADPSTGRETFVEVIDEIEPGATSLTIPAGSLKRPIAAASIALFPPQLSSRNSLSLTREDENTEVENLFNQGWKNYQRTAYGMNVSMPGHYLPTDAGYREVRLSLGENENNWSRKVYVHIVLPAPGCDDTYTKGEQYYGAANVTAAPIELPSKGIANGNIDVQFCGKVHYSRFS